MVEVRELTQTDIPSIVAIQKVITKGKVSAEWSKMMEEHVGDVRRPGFVALKGGKVVGFIIGEEKGEGFGMPRSGWLDMVGVDPKMMGGGVGKAMIKRLFEVFKERGITNIYTSVKWDAVDMLSFFKAVGFDRSSFINLIYKL
ncbi:MAG: N-acetyltransferase [Deltaproteobacteria bacterium]|nr:MAG: N-acetyltransferase [Deltaproteobacteria bacterium]